MTTPFLGHIQYFAFAFSPRGWAQCNGALMSITQNQALFALLGTMYGGDGRTTFGLPDLRGRTIAGYGQGNSIGQMVGTETATMTFSNLPMHTHAGPTNFQIAASSSGSDGGDPLNAFPASTGSRGNMYSTAVAANSFLGAPTVVVANAGAGQPFSTLSPYLVLNVCVALTGIFPSRN